MAKKKSQKKFSSNIENPFNVKINRNKYSILGQKVKGTQGCPGVSRSVSNSKRKAVFHKKKVQSRKANKFVDKRLLNSSQIYEDPATARLIEERKRKFKKNIFNLNEDESLTHKGMPLLNDSNLVNDGIADSDDEEPLDSQFVKQAHFGGFDDDSTVKSRKDIIDDLIVESKIRKNERNLAKEKSIEFIQKLDQEWKEMHVSLPLLKAGKQKEPPEKNDPFDIILQELKFEKRTTPSSRLKTQEEMAAIQSKKLRKLEEERNRRMIDPMDNKIAYNHISADSIDDGIDIQLLPFEDQDVVNTNGKANEHSGDDSDEESSDDEENETGGQASIKNFDSVTESMLNDACEIPVSLDQFCDVINSQNEELYIIVERILNKVIKNKTKENLLKLENFFAVLIQYSMKESKNLENTFDVVDSILPHFYTLAEISPVRMAENLLAFLDEEQEIFQSSKGKKMKGNFPRLQCLILFNISCGIYSVSDFKHPVVTPVITFMCDILSSAFAVTLQNIMTRISICKIIHNCVSYSKRYVSEVICFLNKMLELSINNDKKFNLVIHQVASVQERADVRIFNNTAKASIDDSVKASILTEILELTHQYAMLYSHLPSYHEIFFTSFTICKKLAVTNFPDFLKETITKFISTVESVKKTYVPLTYENKKPIPLKMFEPIFDSKFTRKKDDIKKKRKLVLQVGQKIRREERSLLREMRRDNQVIAAEKLKEKLEADVERKRKVKQLYQELAMQEGEFKKFIKKK